MRLNSLLFRGVVNPFAVFSIGLTAAAQSADASLAAEPREVLLQAMEEGENDGEDDERFRLLAALASDTSAPVRMLAAEGIARGVTEGSVEDALMVLRRLADDKSRDVRARAVEALRVALATAPPLHRIVLAAEWATSPRSAHRHAMARAVTAESWTLGFAAIVDLLAQDDHAKVRHAALDAASDLYARHPELLRATLVRGLDDPVAAVRKAAQRGFRNAARSSAAC